MTIMLIRHGETAWNVREVFRGRIDVELNETGVKQAELLGEYLSHENILAVYSSPLKRALKTAEMIAKHHDIDVEITEGLMDLDFGEWQGLPHETVKEGYGELYRKWLESPHEVRMPNGEGLDDVRERGVRLVEELIDEYGSGESIIALVSHRVVNKVLICALLGLDNSHFWNIKMDTCGITTFEYEKGRFVLTRHNDTSFLKSLGRGKTSDF
ncbi:histidine phosphatase family protein [Candidatus Poribacteria bacterium]|nr:histidine phosphatase family protein [Candidatus Poribacteria bacterium]